MLIYAAIVVAIAMRFLLPRWQKTPPNRIIALLVRPRGVDAPQRGVSLDRAAYLRAARISFVAAVALGVLTWGSGWAGEHSLNGSPVNMLASGALMIGAIGFVMAAIMAVTHLVQAARVKSTSDAPDA